VLRLSLWTLTAASLNIRGNLEEVGVVLATRPSRGIKFPKSGGHKERNIVSHEDGVVVIKFYLTLHVW